MTSTLQTSTTQSPGLFQALGALLLLFSGCQGLHEKPVLLPGDCPAYVPREMDYVNLPTYRIEPPDILLIDALRIVPKEPFRIETNDYLFINAIGTLPEQPINAAYLVTPGGTVDLGASYGRVKVDNLTLDEANVAVEKHLKRILRDPQVSVTLAQYGAQSQIIGERVVGQDGRITMGSYGSVYVSGMTVNEATEAIVQQLGKKIQDPVISVSVAAYNSKSYFVISEGAGLGDNIQRFPVTGKETVLDAVVLVGGISRVANKQIWIARPNPGQDCDQILPVEWELIVKGGSTTTNYQLLPGDRVFIADNPWADLNMVVSRTVAPIERLFNFGLLGSNAAQSLHRFPRGNFNQPGNLPPLP
jgi:polysaccharide export outer membrane protein